MGGAGLVPQWGPRCCCSGPRCERHPVIFVGRELCQEVPALGSTLCLSPGSAQPVLNKEPCVFIFWH